MPPTNSSIKIIKDDFYDIMPSEPGLSKSNILSRGGSFEPYYSSGLTPEKLFGIGNDPYSGSWGNGTNELPRKDDVLNQKFGGSARAIEGYMRLFNDSQVLASFEKFSSEITQRPITVTPVSTSARDEYIAEFVRQCIFKLGTSSRQSQDKSTIAYNSDGYNQITKGLTESLILGIGGAGINWVKQGKHIIPQMVQTVDPRRIEMTMDDRGNAIPRLVVWQDGYLGKALPARTFILHRYWSNISYQDAWGYGLGRQLYPLVEFRRNLLALWLQYCDKNTTPNVVVNYPLGLGKEDVNNVFETAKKFGQQTVAVFPEGVQASYLVPSSSAPNVYQSLVGYLDQQIAWLITGEKEPAQNGQNTGSLPQQDRLSDSVRVKRAKAFNDSLENTINNTLVRWIVELNFGFDVNPPKVSRNFADIVDRTNKQAVLGQLSMLQGMGYVVNDLDWLKEQLDIPSLSYSPEKLQSAQGAGAEPVMQSDQAPTASEPQPLEGGEPAEQYSERLERIIRPTGYSYIEKEDNNDGFVTVENAAKILDIDEDTLLSVLKLTSKDDVVNINELLEDFVTDEGEINPKSLIKTQYERDNLNTTQYYFDRDKSLQSVNEKPEEMESDITSAESTSEHIARSLLGTPQQIGFDHLNKYTVPYEQSRLNLVVDSSTPLYEILSAIGETISELNLSGGRDIRPVRNRETDQILQRLEQRYNSIRAVYLTEDVRYEALVLKEDVREFQKLLNEGYTYNPFDYSSVICNYRRIQGNRIEGSLFCLDGELQSK